MPGGLGGLAGGDDPPDVTPPTEEDDVPTVLDHFGELATGSAQREVLCARGSQDRLAQWYCSPGGAPAITGLDDVLVGLQLKDPAQPQNTRFAFTGHSSSLVARNTSSINPRAVIFSNDNDNDYTALGFVRGDFFAEVASFDPVAGQLNFYLVRFEKGCEPNCTNADKFLPEMESGWQNVSIYNDQDIANTALDCLQCHQPAGAGTQRILRMQELQNPWTHWFRDNRNSNTLLADFQTAHPGEDYAGIPAAEIANSEPADLEDFIRAQGFDNQPNEFLGNDINNDNVNVQTPNGVWLGLYNQAVAGLQISPPYFGIDPYDPAKVQAATNAYLAVRNGGDPANTPDMADIFLDAAYPHLGFVAANNLSAIEIVEHRCGTCHDGRFPGISRDNFRIQNFPNNLDAEMRELILERLRMPDTHFEKMPPIKFSRLTEQQIQLIEAELQ